MVAATSNGVNLTDGLDGLATGASVMVFGAYMLIGVWQFRNACASDAAPHCYEARDPLDLAVFAAAMAGACFGFLWWNASPAQIFMGDTGSLALGGAIAGLAIITRTELLLLLLGGLFVVITLSVILQVGVVQADRQADVPDGAAAAPLRAARLGRGHDRHPVLDHRRALRRRSGSASSTPSGSRAGTCECGRAVVAGRRGPLLAVAGCRSCVAGLGVPGSPPPTPCSSSART